MLERGGSLHSRGGSESAQSMQVTLAHGIEAWSFSSSDCLFCVADYIMIKAIKYRNL